MGIEAERAQAFSSLAGGLFFFGFYQFANYRARRYRLTRTVWRGLRFGMDGSGVVYALRAFGWSALVALSLGLALPWMQASLERYKMRHTHYGEAGGDFVGVGGAFLRAGWIFWLGALVAGGLYVGGAALAESREQPLWMLLTVPAAPLALCVYAWFKAVQWKWWIEGVRIGGAHVTSDLRKGALMGNYWTYAGLSFLVAIVAGLAFAVIVGMVAAAKQTVLLALGAIVYVAMLVVMMAIWRIYFIHRVWRIVVGSLALRDIASLANVAMRPDAQASAIGEGFADSLDVAGF
jgi:uncharacterized membrane protein YjgN (DUF898 family)